jgi:hypothetical protein
MNDTRLIKVRTRKGVGRCRRGATTHCIYCGLPNWLTFAHIHREDLHLSGGDPTRVFCLCWNHHNGAYRQYRILTEELLEYERIWIEEPARRPQPPSRDDELCSGRNSAVSGPAVSTRYLLCRRGCRPNELAAARRAGTWC